MSKKQPDIVDLTEIEPGVFEAPEKIPLPRMSKKKKDVDPLDDMVDGYKEGAKVINTLMKMFGGK